MLMNLLRCAKDERYHDRRGMVRIHGCVKSTSPDFDDFLSLTILSRKSRFEMNSQITRLLKLATDLTRKYGTMALLGQPEHRIAMQFQGAFVFKDIKLVSSWVADSEGQEFIRRFHENKLHVAVKE